MSKRYRHRAPELRVLIGLQPPSAAWFGLSTNVCSVYTVSMCSMPFVRRDPTERAWTEHLATNVGARALLEAVRRAHLPEHTSATLDEILGTLIAETTGDEFDVAQRRPSH